MTYLICPLINPYLPNPSRNNTDIRISYERLGHVRPSPSNNNLGLCGHGQNCILNLLRMRRNQEVSATLEDVKLEVARARKSFGVLLSNDMSVDSIGRSLEMSQQQLSLKLETTKR